MKQNLKSLPNCNTRYCRNRAAPQNKHCYKCKKAKYRELHPLEYFYNILKQNAKRRNKEFTLTFEQFKKFAIETDYITKKGRHSLSYTIDRIDPSKGYSIDNIQILTNAQNVRKQHSKQFSINQYGIEFKTVGTYHNTHNYNTPF